MNRTDYEEFQFFMKETPDSVIRFSDIDFDKFRDLNVGLIGILIVLSMYFFNTSSGRPLVSFPNKTKTSSIFE